MLKTYIRYPFTDEQMRRFEELDLDIIDGRDRDITPEEIAETEAYVSFSQFDKYPLEQWKNLRFVQSLSAGVNTFPMDGFQERGIVLANAKHVYSRPIAEWVVMRILEANKDAKGHFAMERDKHWELNLNLPEITDQKIGIIGTGSIASDTAKLLQVFDAYVIGYNTDGRAVANFDACYPLENIEETAEHLDFLVLCAPETPDLVDFIDAEFLKYLKSDVRIINIGRGSIIDEKALEDFLMENPEAIAILDVFKTEPLPEDHPFWTMDNVWVSPHVSAASNHLKERLMAITLHNLEAYLTGDEYKNQIDLSKGY